jgi:hypothetical protein
MLSYLVPCDHENRVNQTFKDPNYKSLTQDPPSVVFVWFLRFLHRPIVECRFVLCTKINYKREPRGAGEERRLDTCRS